MKMMMMKTRAREHVSLRLLLCLATMAWGIIHVRQRLAKALASRADAIEQIKALFTAVQTQVVENPHRCANPTGFCVAKLFEIALNGSTLVDDQSGEDFFAKAVRESKAAKASAKPAAKPAQRQQRKGTFIRPQVQYTDEERAATRERARAQLAARAKQRELAAQKQPTQS